MRLDPLLNQLGENLAVHRQRRATRHPRLVSAGKEHAAQKTELGLEQAVRGGGFHRLEGVAAHQLGEPPGLVGCRARHRAHLVQRHFHAAFGQRPRGLAPRQAAADDCRLHASDASSGSATRILLPHFMQVSVSPSALVFFLSIPSQPHSGQVSATGLFQVEKSHLG